jgi:hypothetical protein
MKTKFTFLFLSAFLSININAQSLLAHFPLTSNGNDTTGNGNFVTINKGVFGNDGVYFDGTYQVSYGVTNEIEGLKSMPFSISIDFKIDGTFSNGTYPVFVDGENRLAAFTIISNGSTMKAGVFANDNAVNATSSTTINPNTWYHAKLNYDRTKLSLYIDNVFAVDLPVLIVNRNGGATANAIYSQNTASTKTFKGWWKNLKVYNGVVTDTTYTLNATLQQISTPDLVPVGNTDIKGKIQNNGTTNIVSFDVTYIQNSTASAIYSVTGVNIAPGAFYSFTHNVPKNLTAGLNYIKVAISNINGGMDNNYSDDTLAKTIVARHAIDASVLTINTFKYVAKGNTDITGSIKNNSLYPMTSYDVTYNVDGGLTSPIYSVTGINIPYGSTLDFVHNIPANLAVGSHTISVNITNVNGGTDGFLNDNKVSKNVIALSSLPTKRVFAEEGTGTWCSWCPRGTVYMDSMKSKYPTTFIGVAVHGGSVPEPMKDTMYANGMINHKFGSFPGIAVDRQASARGVDPDVVESYFKKRMDEPTPVDVSITNIYFDPATRRLDYSVNVMPAVSINVNWNFNSVIYENDVTWNKPIDSSLYQQRNYYSGGKYGPMGGFENKSNPIPAIDMHYDFVARKIMDGFIGASGIIPTSVTDGTSYSKKYTYIVPDSFDADEIHIVGLVSDASTKEVLNAIETEHAISWYKVGINDVSINHLKVYPNPTSGIVNISLLYFDKVEIYTVMGQLIHTEYSKQLDLSSYTNGTYFLKIYDQKQHVETKRLVLHK